MRSVAEHVGATAYSPCLRCCYGASCHAHNLRVSNNRHSPGGQYRSWHPTAVQYRYRGYCRDLHLPRHLGHGETRYGRREITGAHQLAQRPSRRASGHQRHRPHRAHPSRHSRRRCRHRCCTQGCVDHRHVGFDRDDRRDRRHHSTRRTTHAGCDTPGDGASTGDFRWKGGARRFNIGLFCGLAGVGYTCLREIDSSLPNVLIWE